LNSFHRRRVRRLRRRLHVQTRRIWWPRWRRRVFFLAGGLAVGLCAIGMAIVADRAQVVFGQLRAAAPAAPFIVTPLGFALAAYLTRAYFPSAGGSGIPQVIAAHRMDESSARTALVSMRVAAGKVLLLILGLLCGASAGREGPTVQVGASIMFGLGKLARHREPGLLIAGSAAGIAAAFNAPLAGIIFGIEEMSRSFETRTSGLILGTVIAAGLTSLAILGDYTYFGTTAETLPFGPQWIAVVVAGIVGGLGGGLFSRILIEFGRGLPGAAGRLIRRRPVLFAALCGLAVALCGYATGGSIFGTGYDQAKLILANNDSLPKSFGPLKLASTALSSISGIPGGIFSPSLAVGAGLAQDLLPILPHIPLAVLAILCMSAYLTGVVQAPMTSFVIVSEMTENHALVIPIMICALIANASSRLICPEGVYHALSENYHAAGH
jgi:H+/Cl- antiporter ClcA